MGRPAGCVTRWPSETRWAPRSGSPTRRRRGSSWTRPRTRCRGGPAPSIPTWCSPTWGCSSPSPVVRRGTASRPTWAARSAWRSAAGHRPIRAATTSAPSSPWRRERGCAGLPLGFFLATRPFWGRRAAFTLVNTALAFPTVVTGLLLFGLLSRRGPLGGLGWLYTWQAIALGDVCIALPIAAALSAAAVQGVDPRIRRGRQRRGDRERDARSEEHTSELQSRQYIVCRLLLEKKNTKNEKH